MRAVEVKYALAKIKQAERIWARKVEVLDRPGPEKRVCECCAVMKREFDRLLLDLRALWNPPRTALSAAAAPCPQGNRLQRCLGLLEILETLVKHLSGESANRRVFDIRQISERNPR
jgi:hypothetical protein